MRTLSLLIALSFVLPAVGARAEEPIETWERIHMAGSYVVYQHGTRRTVGEGEDARIESTGRSEISMKRLGAPTEIAVTATCTETADGNLVRVEVDQKMSAQATHTLYTFADGKVTIASTVMGTTRTVEQDVPSDLPGPAKIERATKALAGTTGETIEIVTFSADFQQVVKTTLTSKGKESITFPDGTTGEFTRVDTVILTMEGAPVGMNPVLWIDADGRTMKSKVMAAGLLIETFRVANETAAKEE